MAKRNMSERSLANLTSKGRFGKDRESAVLAGKESWKVRRTMQENEAIIDEFMSDLVEMAFGNSSLEEFKQKATKAPSQALRIVALNLADPKKAMDALSWLIERLKGKPKQINDTRLTATEESLGVIRVVDSRGEK